MSALSVRERVAGWLDIVTIPGAIALLLLLVHTILNAVLRWFGHPLTGTLEYSSYWWMPMIVFLGFVSAAQRHEHIEVLLVFERMPRRIRAEYVVIAQLVVIVSSLLVAWETFHEAVVNMQLGRISAGTAITLWPMGFMAPLGYGLLALHVLLTLGSKSRNIDEVDITEGVPGLADELVDQEGAR